jgi:Ca2+-binding RTX toxin-like protein
MAQMQRIPIAALPCARGSGTSFAVRSKVSGWAAATTNSDTLNRTTSAETTDGLAGNDVISGGGGADRLIGGLGDDTITATGTFDPLTRFGDGPVVSTLTTEPQIQPAMAQLSGGGYVLTWVDETADASGVDVRAQRFDALGAKVGAELLVNAGGILGVQTRPAVTALANNDFVVT